MRCHVKTEKNGYCFVCNVKTCWNISGSDDCIAEVCVNYGKCEFCEFGMKDKETGETICELEQ